MRKTIKAFSACIWWPRLEKSTKTYGSGYLVCIKSKNSTSKNLGLLAPLPIPQHHLDVWSMDFIAALPLSAMFITIYTCINKLSKIVHLMPCFKGEGELNAPKCDKKLLKTIQGSFLVRLFCHFHILYTFSSRLSTSRCTYAILALQKSGATIRCLQLPQHALS